MSGRDDWQPGDYALCVTTSPFLCGGGVWHTGRETVARGSIHRVERVAEPKPRGNGEPCDCGCISLRFAGSQSGISTRFIKVTPPAADEFDRETIELEQRKPVEEVQP